MPNSVKINVVPDETVFANALDRAIRRGMSQASSRFGASGANQLFGQLNAGARQFDSTLQSVNRRVIGFGVSLGVFGTATRLFRELVSSTLEFEKSMAKINSVMALTARQSDSLFHGLYDIARRTGESWQQVAEGFEAAAKTGGAFEQVLRRTNTAAALAKVGNIGVTESVKGLNEAMISFGRAGETWVTIANKISAANRAFPVAVKDIISAVGTFGPQAESAGISLNRFIGIITALKTITGRDGAAISQSLQGIFARITQNANLDKLSGIINIRDQGGNVKSGIQLLNDLAKAYSGLSDAKRRAADQIVGGSGGRGQVATAKALLTDLASANSIAGRTADLVSKATGDLSTRLALQTNNLTQALQNLSTTSRQIAASAGQFILKPAIQNLVSIGNATGLGGGLNPSGQGENAGQTFGQGFLKGIGNVIAGPGLVVLARLFGTLAIKVGKQAFGDLRSELGSLSGAKQQQLQAQNAINQALATGTNQELQRLKAARSVAEAEEVVLAILQRQAAVSSQLAGRNLILQEAGLSQAVRRSIPRAAGGYVPAMQAESAAISAGVGGAPAGSRAVYIPHFAYGGGASGPIVANTSEFMVKGSGGSAIYNRDMIRQHGLPPGAVPVAAAGYVPNAAGSTLKSAVDLAMGDNPVSTPALSSYDAALRRSAGALDEMASSAKAANTELKGQFDQFAKARSYRQQAQNASFPNASSGAPITQRAYVAAMRANSKAAMGGVGGTPLTGTLPLDPRDLKKLEREALQEAEDATTRAGLDELLKRKGLNDAQRQQSIDGILAGRRSAGRRAAFGNKVLGASIGASFVAGFIPERAAGQPYAQAIGAGTGALQGAGIGASAGSLFGPIGTAIGAVGGGITGGILGWIGKSKTSFDELAKAISETTAKNQELTRSVEAYSKGIADIQDAQDSGASPRTIATLKQQNALNIASLPDDVKKQLIALGNAGDVTSLNAFGAKQASIGADYQLRAGAALAVAGIPKYDSPLQLADAANNVGGLFAAKGGDLSGLSKGSPEERIAAFIAIFGRAGGTSDQVSAATAGLGKLKGKGVTDFLGAIFQSASDDRSLNAQSDQITKRVDPAGKLHSDITSLIESLQESQAGNTGLPSYRRRRTGLVTSAAARILGERRVSLGGYSTDSLGLESQYQLSEAEATQRITNRGALDRARLGFLSAGETQGGGSIFSQDQFNAIKGANSIQALKDVSHPGGDRAFGDIITPKLDKLTTALEKAYEQSAREADLVKEEISLRRLELQSVQRGQLISRGGFDTGTLNSFSSAVLGVSSVQSGQFGRYNRVNSSLAQGRILDQLGLAPSDQTAALREQLGAQSTFGTLSALAARKLGRPVGNNVSAAAQELIGTGTTSNVELGKRILESEKLLAGPSSATVASRILRGASGAGGLNIGDLRSAVSSGQASLGEAGVVSGVNQSNQFLKSINDNLAELVRQRGGTPSAGPKRGNAGIRGVLTTHRPPELGLPGDDPNDDIKIVPDKPISPLSAFGSGFSTTLSALNDGLNRFQQLGQQTAETLTNSFSTFFSSFIVGSERGQQAFRQFASSIFADESKLFSQSAIRQLFGQLGNAFDPAARNPAPISDAGGSDLGTSDNFFGGPIGRAMGGSVPTMLTGGEIVIGPQRAAAIGRPALDAMNQGIGHFAGGGGVSMVRGGSGVRDDQFRMVPRGSYVIKKSSAQMLGTGGILHRADGGGIGGSIAGLFGSSNAGLGYGILGGLAGGLLGFLLDRKNRAQGALIGAGLGFGAGYLGNSLGLFGSPVSSAANHASDPHSPVNELLTKFGVAGGLGAISYASTSRPKNLDTQGVINNAQALAYEQQGSINNRPPGTFVQLNKGPNGSYVIANYTPQATSYGYDGGGMVGGASDMSYAPSRAPSAPTVQANITINHQGGATTASSSVQNADSGNPLGTQEFAVRLQKAVAGAVQEQLVQASRAGSWMQNNQRYAVSSYGR